MPMQKPPYRIPSMAEIAKLPWNGFTVASTFAGAGGSSTGYRMAGYRVLLANEFVPIAQESYAANMGPHTYLERRDIKQVTADDVLNNCGLRKGDLDVFDGSPPCQAFSTAGKREKGWGSEKTYEHGASQKNEELFFDYIRLRDGLMPKVFVAENVSGLVKGTAKGFFLEILRELKRGYRVTVPLLDAQWLGVPQARQRIVFIGVRDDLGLDPPTIEPLPYRYSVRDALPWITDVESGRSGFGSEMTPSKPSPAILANPGGKWRKHRIVAPEVERETDISRMAIGSEYDRLNPGQQSDKYFSLVRADPDEPCPTITAAGGSTSIASVVHPTEKRKFSILEVKRLCGFPDDFVLKGTYAQQWERLGNSVPPVMMRAVAEAIRDRVLIPARDAGRTASPPGRSPARSTTAISRKGAAR
jgi:DNA (cytosine-5)-methyltransferase 1